LKTAYREKKCRTDLKMYVRQVVMTVESREEEGRAFVKYLPAPAAGGRIRGRVEGATELHGRL